jgi:hypothetical protein
MGGVVGVLFAAEDAPCVGYLETVEAAALDGATVSELGRRLGVSKQAATKTAASLAKLADTSTAKLGDFPGWLR